MNRGLLLTMTEPPPYLEEEFNAWYDDEHMRLNNPAPLPRDACCEFRLYPAYPTRP